MVDAGQAKGIASQLDLDLDDIGICLACLSFVSMAIDGGDERDVRGQLTRMTPDLWAEGLDRTDERSLVKGKQKPKQLAKKAPQKTLKEKRQEKKAKKKAGGAFDH